MKLLWLIVKTDLTVARRVKSDWLHPWVTFLLLASLLSLVWRSQSDPSTAIGVGSIWLFAMLTSLLALENLFGRDHTSGMLDQYLMHGHPVFLVALGRIVSRYLLIGFPVCLLSSVAGMFIGLTPSILWVLVATLTLATPSLTAIGVLGASLSIGIERSGVLLAILILPLYIPSFLLGVGICQSAIAGESSWGPWLWLAAVTSGTLTIIPFAITASLKVSQEY